MTQAQTKTLWQIGKPSGRAKEFVKAGGWQAEFTYTVGTDANPIEQPNMPSVLVVAKRKQKPNLYSTDKLNIRFTLDRNYPKDELTLFYDFFGSEKDTILVNGQKLAEILGVGEGKLKRNQIPLPALDRGEHTLTFTTSGGSKGGLHWIDYLKLEHVVAGETWMKEGPVGGDIQATDFQILPRQDAPQSRIQRLMVRSGWAIDALGVEYENFATQPPGYYKSPLLGGGGGGYGEFRIRTKDYLSRVSGTWGRQAPGYPKEQIISLQFHTHKGANSRIFGGENPNKEVESFEFTAPEGYEISGFFGATGSSGDILVKLGIYLKSVTSTESDHLNLKPAPDKTEKASKQNSATMENDKAMANSGKTSKKESSTYKPEKTEILATGLEDYAFWLKTVAKEQAAKGGQKKKDFRRGRIWA